MTSMHRPAPYRHADGSNCWTKNCKRNQTKVPSIEEFFSAAPHVLAEKKQPESNPGLELRRRKLTTLIDEFQQQTGKHVAMGTVHGSHLYGMSHAGSDEDYYIVTTGDEGRYRRTSQTIVNGIDTVSVNFPYFVELANSGSHQALEAMFSNESVGDELQAYRSNYYVGTNVYQIYETTIKSFALSNDYKRRRHALRLAHNLNEMLERGRFNPTLSPEVAETISRKTNATADEYFAYINEISVTGFSWNTKN